MTDANAWVLFPLAAVLVLGSFTFLNLPPGRWRITATVIFIALAAMVFPGSAELLGRPKPAMLEWRKLAGSEIIGIVPVEGQAIFLWVLRDGEPMTYVMPWNTSDAQELQDEFRRMQMAGGTLIIGGKLDGLEGDQTGEISTEAPPPPLEPKQP